jgi:hypothetical protein
MRIMVANQRRHSHPRHTSFARRKRSSYPARLEPSQYLTITFVRQIRRQFGHWANFLIASALIGVKKLTKLPSGSRNKSERFPQGIVVGA